jgi:hypothetical protein
MVQSFRILHLREGLGLLIERKICETIPAFVDVIRFDGVDVKVAPGDLTIIKLSREIPGRGASVQNRYQNKLLCMSLARCWRRLHMYDEMYQISFQYLPNKIVLLYKPQGPQISLRRNSEAKSQ